MMVAEPGWMSWRSAVPQAMMLPGHRRGVSTRQPPHTSPHTPPRHPPVIGTVAGVGDSGVSTVGDEPLAGVQGAQADGWPLGAGHVGAVGIEVTQEEDVLWGSALCRCPQTLWGTKGSLKS